MSLSGFRIQGPCEWCGKESDQLTAIRDWEEALTGPEYWVCPECVGKEREGFEAASAEWAAYMEKRYVEEKEAAEEAAIPIDPIVEAEERYREECSTMGSEWAELDRERFEARHS